MGGQVFHVRGAAVLGAGVMGAQIAALLVNAGLPTLLYDLPEPGAEPGARARRALEALRARSPAAFVAAGLERHVECLDLARDLDRLAGCQFVLEAVSERLEVKRALYAQVAPFLSAGAVLATNTSGLSVEALARGLPEALRPLFCGVHFFNPPRHMPLVELVATTATAAGTLEALESFLVSRLGKSVVRAPDSPNFIANRLGVFAMLAALHHAEHLGLPPDTLDALTGAPLGRPRTGTCRLADVIGLDVLGQVVHTLERDLPHDPWRAHFRLPAWMQGLVERGALGDKASGGVYRREDGQARVLDPASGRYRAPEARLDARVVALANTAEPGERLARLRQYDHPQARLLWAVQRELFHYCAVHLAECADNARDVDLALRWGYGWRQGPFETWQAAGWRRVAAAIAEDIEAGQTMASAPLPAWVTDGREGVHGPQGSWSAAAACLRPRSSLALYRRQLFPDRVAGEEQDAGVTLMESETVRLWHTRQEEGRRVAVLSFKSKMNAMGPAVCEGIVEAVARAERDHDALVIWQMRPPFSAGADLKAMEQGALAGDFGLLERYLGQFQQMNLRLKYAQVPVVAAVHGLALGGGCEVLMHCARTAATLDSQIGLVETAVGLIPGGGGCKEFALRCAALAARGAELGALLAPVFGTLVRATRAQSAPQARELGFLRQCDPVVAHPAELLHVARQTALALAETPWTPPLVPRAVPVAGRAGIAALEAALAGEREAGRLSGHDERVARAVATALCGGEVAPGTRLDEGGLLAVEREGFLALLRTEHTLARIRHMLEHGQALRN